MSDHDKLREAIAYYRAEYDDHARYSWHKHFVTVFEAALSTLPKTREASVYIIIGTSKVTGNVSLSQPIYGAFGGPLPDQIENFKMTCDAVRVLGPFPQEVPA